MDATRRTFPLRTRPWTSLVSALTLVVAVLAVPATPTEAAPIRALAAARTSGTYLPTAWEQFLSAPDLWTVRRAPAFSPYVRRVIQRTLDGDPQTIAASPILDYLAWRRDLNPTRFDRFHPWLGPRLAQALTPPPPPLVPIIGTPTLPEIEPIIRPLAPLTTDPPAVPEPTGIMLIGLIAAWGLWRRSRDGSRIR